MKTISRRLTVPGFEIREQHYVPGYRATWHSHDEAEFCLVFGGRMTEEIHCGTRLLVTSARGSFKPAGLRHRVDVSGEAVECIVIAVSPERLQEQEPLGRALGRPFLLDESHLHRLRSAMKTELRANDDFSGVALERRRQNVSSSSWGVEPCPVALRIDLCHTTHPSLAV